MKTQITSRMLLVGILLGVLPFGVAECNSRLDENRRQLKAAAERQMIADEQKRLIDNWLEEKQREKKIEEAVSDTWRRLPR